MIGEIAAHAKDADVPQPVCARFANVRRARDELLRGLRAGEPTAGAHLAPFVVGVFHIPRGESHQEHGWERDTD